MTHWAEGRFAILVETNDCTPNWVRVHPDPRMGSGLMAGIYEPDQAHSYTLAELPQALASVRRAYPGGFVAAYEILYIDQKAMRDLWSRKYHATKQIAAE